MYISTPLFDQELEALWTIDIKLNTMKKSSSLLKKKEKKKATTFICMFNAAKFL